MLPAPTLRLDRSLQQGLSGWQQFGPNPSDRRFPQPERHPMAYLNSKYCPIELSIWLMAVRSTDGNKRTHSIYVGGQIMRVMVIVKASKESEAGILPSKEILGAMGTFNEELVKAGVFLAAEGLHASSKGKRVRFSDGKSTVIDGPFTETKELIAGFWLWKVKSMEEAVEWLKRSPFGGDTEV